MLGVGRGSIVGGSTCFGFFSFCFSIGINVEGRITFFRAGWVFMVVFGFRGIVFLRRVGFCFGYVWGLYVCRFIFFLAFLLC